MSVVLPITENQRYAISTASGGETSFSVPFPFQANADVTIVKVSPLGLRTTLVLGAHYTLTGAGNPSGGTVTLATPLLAGEKLERIGRAVLTRTADVTRAGRFRSRATDDELDRLTIIAQEHRRDIDRTWKAPPGTSGGEISAEAIENAEAWAEIALAAAAQAQAGVGEAAFPTFALAEAYAPETAPAQIRTHFHDDAQQQGSGALYKLNGTSTGDLVITLADGVTQVGYDIAEPILRPEMFGRIGVDAAGDTAAWVALASVVNARGAGVVKASGEYLIDGSDVVFDADEVHVEAYLAVFRQQSTYSKTISFADTRIWSWKGGTFHGLGGDSGEFNGASSSYNGVAAIHSSGSDHVLVQDVFCFDHAGPDLMLHDTRRTRTVRNCVLVGIGSGYIVAVDNGYDFAIGGYTTSTTIRAGEGWQCVDRIENNTIRDHAFVCHNVAVGALIATGNDIQCLGQHCFYTTECDNILVTGNRLHDAPQNGIKMSIENYAGKFVGASWETSTAYEAGDDVRYDWVCYRCIEAHTSGSDFATDLANGKWELSPRNYPNGGVIADNIIERAAQAILVIQQGDPNGAPGKDCWYNNLVIANNRISDMTGEGIYLNAARRSKVTGNVVHDCLYGFFGLNFDGSVIGNTFRDIARPAILLGLTDDTVLNGNTYIDCALLGSGGSAENIPVRIAGVSNIPGANPTPNCFMNGDIYIFTGGGDAAGDHLCYVSDADVTVHVQNISGTPTTKTFRVSGTVGSRFHNHFPGFLNSAQNPPSYTVTNGATDRSFNANSTSTDELADVLATLLSDLSAMKVLG